MKVLVDIPRGLEAINERYGCPDEDGDGVFDPDFASSYLMRAKLPFPMRISWKPGQTTSWIYGHIAVVPVIVDALREVKEFGGLAYLQENGFDEWGGCWNWRPMRNGKAWSTHSWGIAVDINPTIAPFGKVSRQPQFIIDAFMNRGFLYGGTFKITDGMHFQACTGY